MAQTLAIIDYGSGNLRSVAKALERAAADVDRPIHIKITASAADVAQADRIVLPGVGAFGQCASALRALPDMEHTLHERVMHHGVPFLGICVGMQLMASHGLEYGTHIGLGWIPGNVRPLAHIAPTLKIPHMGWNSIHTKQNHYLLDSDAAEPFAYFVHSYHFVDVDPAHVVCTTDHGHDIVAMVAKNNIAGTQFHPEKSQAFGLTLLAKFLRWTP